MLAITAAGTPCWCRCTGEVAVPLPFVPSTASRPGAPAAHAAPATAPAPRPARPLARHPRQERRRLCVRPVRARDGAGPVRGGRRDAEQVGGGADPERQRRPGVWAGAGEWMEPWRIRMGLGRRLRGIAT